jgi:CDP-glucose 4,6-dehydratase
LESLVLMNGTFWKNKKVLITGHTGFKGSWLSHWLVHLGAEVTGLSLDEGDNTFLWKQLNISPLMKSVCGDLRDPEVAKQLIRETAPEIIFHLAAQSLVKIGFSDPLTTFHTNIMGTTNLILAARESHSLRVILNVTTDKVYGPSLGHHAHSESNPLLGLDPYSASKACSELVTRSLTSAFFQDSSTAIATARAGNVIGGGDMSAARLMPDIIRAISAQSPILIRQPHSVRPWQHVLDSLNGYLMYAEYLFRHRTGYLPALNFSPAADSRVAVEDILKLIQKNYPHLNLEYQITRGEFHEEKDLILDSSLAKKVLNWEGLWSVDKAVGKTIEWYERKLAGESASKILTEQLKDFCR